jgi:hypothetical protein
MHSSRPYFEEVQSMQQVRWIWYFLVPFLLLTFIPVGYMLYWQFIEGAPLGDTPMSDSGLLLFSGFMIGTAFITVWLLVSAKLEMYVDQDGIHYKFYPLSPRWKLIQKENIVNVEICRKRNFLAVKIGYHKSPFRKTISMIISGSLHIRFQLDDGWKLLIGTQNPEDFERAVRRLMTNDQIM